MSEQIILFVYGTLRLGSEHPMGRRLHIQGRFVGHGKTVGTLYDLGIYPGATFVPGSKGKVIGDVFAVRRGSRLLAALDAYEGGPEDHVGTMYGRVEIEVALAAGRKLSAQSYTLRRPASWARPVASGDWLAHLRVRAARPRRP